MTDLRARLADALRDHADWDTTCRCGHKLDYDTELAHAQHVANVLVSLPGIAIVELPEKPPGKPFWPTRASNSWTGDDYESFVDATPGSGVVQTAIFQYTTTQARDLAAAFLAAANAAEEEQSS